ncbi:MAG: hypothetical protein ACFE7R_03395, partial [Candidatus Hodarchaeota archaeon]
KESISELLDVITRQVVNKFLIENPELRGNAKVSQRRRRLLRRAKREDLAPHAVEQALSKELQSLLPKEV